MNSTNLQKGALGTRQAHLALLNLKRFVDEATQTTHTSELEAVSLAISPRQGGDNLATLQVVVERLQSKAISLQPKLTILTGNGAMAVRSPLPMEESHLYIP